jgi:hypothetical protein
MEKLKVVLFKENGICYNTLFFFSSKDVVEKIIEEIFKVEDAQFYCENPINSSHHLIVSEHIKENLELFSDVFFCYRALIFLDTTSGHKIYASSKDSISLLHSIKTGIVDMNMESIGMENVSKIVEAIQKGTFSNYEIEIEERESPKKI